MKMAKQNDDSNSRRVVQVLRPTPQYGRFNPAATADPTGEYQRLVASNTTTPAVIEQQPPPPTVQYGTPNV